MLKLQLPSINNKVRSWNEPKGCEKGLSLLAWYIAIRTLTDNFKVEYLSDSFIYFHEMIIVLKHENMFSLFIIIMPSSSSFSHTKKILLRCFYDGWGEERWEWHTIIIIYRKISAIKDHFFRFCVFISSMDDEWALKWKLFSTFNIFVCRFGEFEFNFD